MKYENLKKVNELAKSIERLEGEVNDIEDIMNDAKLSGYVIIGGSKIDVSSSFLTSERTALMVKIENLKQIIETL